MPEGVIKRTTVEGFGYIDVGSDDELFFHRSAVLGTRFEDLRGGQRVSFTEGRKADAPRAENVKPV
jgi:CspA family cold shock protein